MPILTTWDASYSVGNTLLDSQHRKLLTLCDALRECAATSGRLSDERFHDILNELAVYAREHFASEEEILERCAYPLLEQQREDHLRYEERVTEALSAATFGKLEKAELLEFISGWWLHHILVSDMAYRDSVTGLAA